jgi:Ca2+-binding EF-hand superfamily protein
MRTKSLLGATALVFFALTLEAGHAQSKGATANLDAFMQQWDPDHDGTLSLDEVKKAADARFDALDADHDGSLDKKELGRAVSARDLKRADTDKDGTLDKTEYEAIATQRFQAADRDHDGTKRFLVHFTSMSPAVETFIRNLVGQAIESKDDRARRSAVHLAERSRSQ